MTSGGKHGLCLLPDDSISLELTDPATSRLQPRSGELPGSSLRFATLPQRHDRLGNVSRHLKGESLKRRNPAFN